MKILKEYIESGILESYVLGLTNGAESAEVEKMSAAHSEISTEINIISATIERYAELNAVKPPITIKPFLLAIIDYTERLKNGEPDALPPILHKGSAIEDYADWLNAKAAVLPDDFNNLHARIIGYSKKVVTAIIWVKEFTPPEIHKNEFEKFLIVEGTCDITIGKEVYNLVAGDMLSIPLHVIHNVKVTSEIPCKAILQRIAA
ncbi:MAG: cupin domain-containing protein [Ginsengibacter sp.]